MNPVRTLWKPETIEQMTFAPGVELSLASNSGQLPRDRYMTGVMLQWRGRITNASSGNPTGFAAGGIANLFNTIRVYGRQRVRQNSDTLVELSGSNLAQIERVYTKADPVQSGTLVTTANATQDIEYNLLVPFVPMGVHPAEQKNHLLDATNYDTLFFKINTGSYGTVYTGHSTAGTFSAFGSSSGSPVVNVTGIFASEPATRFRGFLSGVLSRYQKDAISGSVLTTSNRTRIFDMPKGTRLRGAFIKTGTLVTGLGTQRAYASLSDNILTNLIVNRGSNRRVWDVPNFGMGRALTKVIRGIQPETGFCVVDWVNSGGFQELFDATNLVAGSTGEIDFYVDATVAGAANQQAELIVEEQTVPWSYIG